MALTAWRATNTSTPAPRFLAVDLQRQLIPGSVEHALNHLIDHELVLSSFDARYQNDQTGAAAYSPAMLLMVILFAYSQGIVSSRGIERDCRDHVTFIALSEDTMPHFTTIAGFVPPRSFGFGFLQTSPHNDALAVLLAFGSAKTWLPDFHRHSYVPCPAHRSSSAAWLMRVRCSAWLGDISMPSKE